MGLLAQLVAVLLRLLWGRADHLEMMGWLLLYFLLMEAVADYTAVVVEVICTQPAEAEAEGCHTKTIFK